MVLKYLGGTLPNAGVYAPTPGRLTRLPAGSWDLNAHTVTSVEFVAAGKRYNDAAGGAGIVAGGIVAGPIGAVVGGLLPKAFTQDVVQFVIRFRNGDVAHFSGSPGDYQRALRSSYAGAQASPETRSPQGESPNPRPAPPQTASAMDGQRAGTPAEPVSRDQVIADHRAEMAAIREARGPRMEYDFPARETWFQSVPPHVDLPGPIGETPAQRREREKLNRQNRKTYMGGASRGADAPGAVLPRQPRALHRAEAAADGDRRRVQQPDPLTGVALDALQDRHHRPDGYFSAAVRSTASRDLLSRIVTDSGTSLLPHAAT